MEIKLQKIHIMNLRSIKETEIDIGDITVLFGMNDSGKSNFVLALRIAFGNYIIEKNDVFTSPNQPYSKEHSVVVDLLFVPTNENGERVETFNQVWGTHFGVNVGIDKSGKEFFAFRTEFTYNIDREEYLRDRKIISNWSDSIIQTNAAARSKTLAVFDLLYLDAQRDIASDIRDKTSVWSKQISKIKLSPDSATQIESSLANLSEMIINESPFLQQVATELKSSTNTNNSHVEISPLTRSADDLYKGLDIFISQEASSLFPISNLGLGTRSRAVFSTIKAIVNKRLELAVGSPYFCLLAFEEPESHIHPNSQRQLIHDFSGIKGQKLITTHSPYLLSTTSINNLVYVTLKNAETIFSPIKVLELSKDDLRQINRFVLATRGELLFSRITILVEGETEEQALSVFFKEFFKKEPFELNVNIIGVGGKNYLPFLRVLKSMNSQWIIFSDGEQAALSDLQTTFMKLHDQQMKPDLATINNLIILEDSHDFETYLLSQDYDDQIIEAINLFENENQTQYQDPYFDYYQRIHKGRKVAPQKNDVTNTDNEQDVSDPVSINCDPKVDKRDALRSCMKSGKAKYSTVISESICRLSDVNRKFPPRIKDLMELIKVKLEILS